MYQLYLALFITTFCMIAVLLLVFFESQFKTVLTTRVYLRAFKLLSVFTVAAILFTTAMGFTWHARSAAQAMVITTAAHQ